MININPMRVPLLGCVLINASFPVKVFSGAGSTGIVWVNPTIHSQRFPWTGEVRYPFFKEFDSIVQTDTNNGNVFIELITVDGAGVDLEATGPAELIASPDAATQSGWSNINVHIYKPFCGLRMSITVVSGTAGLPVFAMTLPDPFPIIFGTTA